jgi:hypothetical protein
MLVFCCHSNAFSRARGRVATLPRARDNAWLGAALCNHGTACRRSLADGGGRAALPARSAMRTDMAQEASSCSPRSGEMFVAASCSPRSGEMFVAVGCAYSRHPRYRTQNQPHPGGVQQHAESIVCRTPPGCKILEQTIPWVLQTHGYKHCTTPWCENTITK